MAVTNHNDGPVDNVRDLVETALDNNDIAPLVRSLYLLDTRSCRDAIQTH